MTRRRTAAAAALVLLAAGCGRLADDGGGIGSGGGIGYATGASDLVLQVTTSGGFMMPNYALRTFPTFSLYGDGTAIVVGPQIEIYPPPALPPLLSQRLTASGMQKVLEAARDAGVFADATYDDFCGIADVGTTTIVANVDGVRHETSAYALGFDGCTDDPEARAALSAFVNSLPTFSGLDAEVDVVGSMGPYAFSSLALIVGPAQLMADLPQGEVAWPLATPLAGFGEPYEGLDLRCGVVTGADVEVLLPMLEQANELTPWTSGGASWSVLPRPLLPDETACPSLDGGAPAEPMR
ncbi:MAG: hypothetical protein ACKO8G_04600 [Actinomycetota bacterium]